jgi:hypothetical protein
LPLAVHRSNRFLPFENSLAQRRPELILPIVTKLRAVVGTSVILAFFTALTLASSPQLHEQLHGFSPQHECGATLIASGNYHHSAPPPVAPAEPLAPSAPGYSPQTSELIHAAVPYSILEHAPPALI